MPDTPQPVAESASVAHYHVLLEIADCIALHENLQGMMREVAARLRRVMDFDFVAFILHDPERNVMLLHVMETQGARQLAVPSEVSVRDSMSGWVWENQQPLFWDDIATETRFQAVMEPLRSGGIKSCCVLPMTSAQRRLGALSFGSRRPAACSGGDVEFLKRVAEQVAVAVGSALNLEQARAYQEQLTHERDQAQLLLDVNNVLVSSRDIRDLFPAISSTLKRVVQQDYASLALHETQSGQLRLHALVFPEGRGVVHPEMVFPVEGWPGKQALIAGEPLLVERLDLERFPSEITRRMLAEGVQCACWLPLTTRNGVLGTLSVGSLQPAAFTDEHVQLLAQVARQIAIALENALAFREIAELKDKLAAEKLYLQDEIRTHFNFDEIVGESDALKKVLHQVETVAATNATVLVLGETGTGKELVARAIHNLSTRSERTFVKLNCAAIPTGLLESELFGHEKGAFTGAISRKVGRVELAHQGTLFLDEVGDIPLELQPKLLRVLQEKEFERLGSNQTQRVDVRLVAATNRSLATMVEEGTFRRDLFYRLNVFPILVPPLRERREDIPLLVRYFAQKLARNLDRKIETIPTEAMQALSRWSWPGNIRELENLVERAVIISNGPVLQVPLAELQVPEPAESAASPESSAASAGTLEDSEREHILRVLRETKGVIAGPHGAAARLGLKRTTLHFKMKKLGISRDEL